MRDHIARYFPLGAHLVVPEGVALLLDERERGRVPACRGGTVILAENDSNDSKIIV